MMKTACTWIDSNGKATRFQPNGRQILVRKCLRDEDEILVGGEIPDGVSEEDARLAELITQRHKRRACWLAEVLAIGPLCGTPYSKKEKKKLKAHLRSPLATRLPVNQGDFVMLPELSVDQLLNRYVNESPHDALVDETVLIAVIPASEG